MELLKNNIVQNDDKIILESKKKYNTVITTRH